MSSPFRNFLYFPRRDRRGVLLLILLIGITIGVTPFYRRYKESQTGASTADSTLQQAYEELKTASASRKKSWEKDDRRHRPFPPKRRALTPFPFDPNTADSALLCRLGLPGWMAGNIVRYREKGGFFRRPEDFRKIYGLTDEQFDTLRPYLRLAPEQPERKEETAPPLLVKTETDRMPRAVKYPAGTVIELNSADTTELKKIPGIGSGIARLIANYRYRLGGFYRIEQLGEIDLDYEQLRPWFRIDTTAIRRLNLNRAGIERLRHHPYLNFYQAKAIVEWRRKKGKLTSLKPLRLYEEFPKADLERLAPYVCFE